MRIGPVVVRLVRRLLGNPDAFLNGKTPALRKILTSKPIESPVPPHNPAKLHLGS